MDKKRLQERIKKYKTRLDLYYKAEEAILDGAQSYTIGSRNLTRANLAEIRKMITELEKSLDEMETQLNSGYRRKCVRAIPRDV